MKCIYCGKNFDPLPPRRRVCPACCAQRPAHLRARCWQTPVPEKKAAPAAMDLRAVWRERNVIPFPGPPTSPFKPFFPDSAA